MALAISTENWETGTIAFAQRFISMRHDFCTFTLMPSGKLVSANSVSIHFLVLQSLQKLCTAHVCMGALS